ncbi:MAG: hypothetical protein H6723_15835 [Sandaracinus sp.]|nr:hypothetical protein [Sandaracinus sp.]
MLHATSLALFALALLLVRRVFLALGLARLPALVATLAYGLHPAQVEAVSWATGRKEIVALALACGAILLHLRSESPWSARSWGSRALYVLAALAKTTVLPLPLVLFLADVLLKPEGTWRERIRRGALAHAPTLALGIGFGVVVMSIWESSQMVRPGLEGAGPLMLVASTVTHHVGHALAPFGASPVYPIHRDLEGFGFVDVLGPLALAVGLALPSPRGRFSLLAFVALFLPVSNLVPSTSRCRTATSACRCCRSRSASVRSSIPSPHGRASVWRSRTWRSSPRSPCATRRRGTATERSGGTRCKRSPKPTTRG